MNRRAMCDATQRLSCGVRCLLRGSFRFMKHRSSLCYWMSELRIGQIANRLLGTVMTIERGFIRSGIRFPMGGSLLLVARKS